MARTLRSWLWELGRYAGGHAWPWLAALLLLVAAAGVQLAVVAPARQELDSLRSQALALQQQAQRMPRTDAAAPPSAEARLAAFYRYFPAEASLPDWQEKILTMATAHRLAVSQGDFRVTRDKSGKLARCQMRFPLQGSYPDIRRFIAQLLSDVRIAALDNVSFERQKIGDSQVRAEVELTLYLESEA